MESINFKKVLGVKTQKESMVWCEIARRYKAFHNGEDMNSLKLWGLFNWGFVSKMIEQGVLLTDYRKENKIIFVRPSVGAIERYIKPLLSYSVADLERGAGWMD